MWNSFLKRGCISRTVEHSSTKIVCIDLSRRELTIELIFSQPRQSAKPRLPNLEIRLLFKNLIGSKHLLHPVFYLFDRYIAREFYLHFQRDIKN